MTSSFLFIETHYKWDLKTRKTINKKDIYKNSVFESNILKTSKFAISTDLNLRENFHGNRIVFSSKRKKIFGFYPQSLPFPPVFSLFYLSQPHNILDMMVPHLRTLFLPKKSYFSWTFGGFVLFKITHAQFVVYCMYATAVFGTEGCFSLHYFLST